MRRIRVLLAEMPRTVRESLMQAVADQADMEIVGETDSGVGLLLAAGRTEADVVVMRLDDSEIPGICSHLLDEYPNIKVLALSGDARQVFLYALQPQSVLIGEVSPGGLVDAIRSVVDE